MRNRRCHRRLYSAVDLLHLRRNRAGRIRTADLLTPSNKSRPVTSTQTALAIALPRVRPYQPCFAPASTRGGRYPNAYPKANCSRYLRRHNSARHGACIAATLPVWRLASPVGSFSPPKPTNAAEAIYGRLVQFSCPSLDQADCFFRIILATWTWPGSADARSVLFPIIMICLT